MMMPILHLNAITVTIGEDWILLPVSKAKKDIDNRSKWHWIKIVYDEAPETAVKIPKPCAIPDIISFNLERASQYYNFEENKFMKTSNQLIRTIANKDPFSYMDKKEVIHLKKTFTINTNTSYIEDNQCETCKKDIYWNTSTLNIENVRYVRSKNIAALAVPAVLAGGWLVYKKLFSKPKEEEKEKPKIKWYKKVFTKIINLNKE